MRVLDLIAALGDAALGGMNTMESKVTVIDQLTGREFEIVDVIDQHHPSGVTLRIEIGSEGS